MRAFVDALVADRVHFRTDGPMFDAVVSKGEWTYAVRSLAQREEPPLFTTGGLIQGEGAKSL